MELWFFNYKENATTKHHTHSAPQQGGQSLLTKSWRGTSTVTVGKARRMTSCQGGLQMLVNCSGTVTLKKPSSLPSFTEQKEGQVEIHHLFGSIASHPSLLHFLSFSPQFPIFSSTTPFPTTDCPPCLSGSLPPHSPVHLSLLSQPRFSSKTTLSHPIHLLFVHLLLLSTDAQAYPRLNFPPLSGFTIQTPQQDITA